MSTAQNSRWLESAYENFSQALASGDLELARDIIGDTRDAGFTLEAKSMERELLEEVIE